MSGCELRKDVDFFISSSLPPKEKVFVEGKMLDAQAGGGRGPGTNDTKSGLAGWTASYDIPWSVIGRGRDDL